MLHHVESVTILCLDSIVKYIYQLREETIIRIESLVDRQIVTNDV